MSDIVEELRSRTTGIVLLSDPPQFKKDGLCQQAANEIERLRAENEKLRAALKAFVPDSAVTDPNLPDSRPIDVLVRVGDLRAARAALKDTGK